VLNGEPSHGDSQDKRKKRHVYSPKKRAEIGKLAGQIGPSEAARRFTRKLGYSVNESTARRFKKLYDQERKIKRMREEPEDIIELPLKKRGRPLLLGKRLDDQVQEYIMKLREYGCVVNTTIVVAAARGLATVIEPSRLSERGGPATLSYPWAKSLLK